jgi:hypothetical protein
MNARASDAGAVAKRIATGRHGIFRRRSGDIRA